MVEISIDDMNPEVYSYLLEELFALGVLDVNIAPVQMKKNHPGVLLRVLLEPSMRQAALEILFRRTTTLDVPIQENGDDERRPEGDNRLAPHHRR